MRPHSHGHTHGLLRASLARSREGLRAVGISLLLLGITAGVQAVIYLTTGSVALLADLIHNANDALTAFPLAAAFLIGSARVERAAGIAIVLAIFASACFAGFVAIEKIINPSRPDNLGVLALAGAIGFVGNEAAARVRLRAGKRLESAALIADGNHARTDGLVSLGVVATSIFVAFGLTIADPVIALVITAVILDITWESWKTVTAG